MIEDNEAILIRDVKSRFERQEILTKEFRDKFFINYTFFTEDHITATEEDFEEYMKYWKIQKWANLIKFIERIKKLKSIY